MYCRLKLHPQDRSSVGRIEVRLERTGTALRIGFETIGPTASLHVPAVGPPARTDGLWRRTCFEAFVRPERCAHYYELNFSPSTAWAAYRFGGYRDGMADAELATPPKIEMTVDEDRLRLTAAIDLDRLPGIGKDWRVGLSAVIEEAKRSHWALAHPSGPPDFHHEDCFALQVPAATRR